jgi:hypothetical protein
MPVVPPRRDSARHNREHRTTPHAEIASALDHDPARRAACIRRSAELAIAVTVAVEPEPATCGPARSTAVDACSRPGGLHRGRGCEPPLDVERVMNDSWRASGRFRHWGRPGARRRRCL